MPPTVIRFAELDDDGNILHVADVMYPNGAPRNAWDDIKRNIEANGRAAHRIDDTEGDLPDPLRHRGKYDAKAKAWSIVEKTEAERQPAPRKPGDDPIMDALDRIEKKIGK